MNNEQHTERQRYIRKNKYADEQSTFSSLKYGVSLKREYDYVNIMIFIKW